VRQGQVAAALRDHQVRGLDPRGIDWVPAAAAPARRVVIPGVPAGGGQRLLHIFAPGEIDAIVRLRLLAADGPFVPAAADVLEVAAGSVFEIDVTKQLGGQAMAVELTADVPVTAGLLARAGAAAGQLEELAYTAAQPSLSAAQPGVVARAGARPPTTSLLALAAPDGAATVRVSAVPPASGSRLVSVPEGSQVMVDLSQISAEAAFAAVVAPASASAPVVASVMTEEPGRFGNLLSIAPVAPGRFTVRAPRVVADLSTSLSVEN